MGFFDLFKKKETVVEPPVETPPVVNNDSMPQAPAPENIAQPEAPLEATPEVPSTDDLPPAEPAE